METMKGETHSKKVEWYLEKIYMVAKASTKVERERERSKLLKASLIVNLNFETIYRSIQY